MSFKDLFIRALQFCAIISQACNESLPGVTRTLSSSDYSCALCTAARMDGALTVQLYGSSGRECFGDLLSSPVFSSGCRNCPQMGPVSWRSLPKFRCPVVFSAILDILGTCLEEAGGVL